MNFYILKFILTIAIVVGVIFTLTYIGPEKIITNLGIQNTYIIVFILGIVGGVSAFSAILKFILTIAIVVGVIFTLTYIGPEKIITNLGIQNTYIIVFILGIVGGVSAFSAAGFYATLFSLAIGGANPFLLALFSAPGVLIGDFIFWYLGVESREMIQSGYGSYLKKFTSWFESKPKWLAPIIIYIYTGLTPLPGDFLMFSLAFLNYRFKQIIVPTLLGNYTLALIVSSAGIYL